MRAVKLRSIISFRNVLIAFLASSAFVLLVVLTKYRHKYYYYDVSLDQIYNFENALRTKSKLTDGVLFLDNISLKDKTSFVHVCLDSGLTAKIFQPCVSLESDSQTIEQCFAYSSSGCRYLNISPLSETRAEKIKLAARNTSLKTGEVSIYQYDNPVLTNKKVLVVAAHPDDAEIAAYGLYSSIVEPMVVTVTVGDSGGHKYDELFPEPREHYIEKGKVRTLNSIFVPRMGGVSYENILNLGYFDGTLQGMHEDRETEIQSVHTGLYDVSVYRSLNVSHILTGQNTDNSWNSLVESLKTVIEKYNPDVVVTAHPFLDTNPDHKHATEAVFEAIETSDSAVEEIMFYSNHFRFSEYFPYGKQGDVFSLPPNFKSNFTYDFIYSHNTDRDVQARKVLALDAMNDLRQDTEWSTVKGAAKQLTKNLLQNISDREWGYFRRGIRTNELFFVIKSSNLPRFRTEYSKAMGESE